jgi:RNA polymerase sigma factor (sigma-70 family)
MDHVAQNYTALDRMFRSLARRHPESLRDELVQEAFEKVCRYQDRFEQRPGVRFTSYAYRIASNAMSTYTYKHRRIALDPRFDDATESGFFEELVSRFDERRLDAWVVYPLLDELAREPQCEHMVGVLREVYLDGKSFQELAADRGVSHQALHHSAGRGVARLREMLESRGG